MSLAPEEAVHNANILHQDRPCLLDVVVGGVGSDSSPHPPPPGLPPRGSQSLCFTLQALAQGVCCGCYCRGHSCVVARVAAARILLAARWLCGLLCVAYVIPGPSSVQGRGGCCPRLAGSHLASSFA